MSDHTFVILAYKESPYLEACVHSILNQTDTSQVIMTTSTPCNFSREIAIANNVKYIVNETNEKGVVNDFNFAYGQAQTKYVTLAHQDDKFEKDFSKKVVVRLNKTKNPLIAFTNTTDLIDERIVKIVLRLL